MLTAPVVGMHTPPILREYSYGESDKDACLLVPSFFFFSSFRRILIDTTCTRRVAVTTTTGDCVVLVQTVLYIAAHKSVHSFPPAGRIKRCKIIKFVILIILM